jgi:hypothetical protein
MFRKLAVAFSVANLCFFKSWREILSPQTIRRLYFWKEYPSHAAGVALAVNLLLLTALFLVVFTILWRMGSGMRNVARVAFLVVFLRALNGVRIQFETLSTGHLRSLLGRVGFLAVGLALGGLLLFLIRRYGLQRVTRSAVIVALVMAPFGLIGVAQFSWLTFKYRHYWHDQPSASALSVDRSHEARVVWIIFDEMSQYQAFSHRTPNLTMPNFDRLISESFAAANAFSPAGHTSQSLPALLTGKLISSVEPAAPNELTLQFPNRSGPAKWSEEPDIFSEARTAGFNSALVGWYHPYCRIEGSRLTSCYWQPANLFGDPDRFSTIKNLRHQVADLLTMIPFTKPAQTWLSPRSPDDYRTPQLAVYQMLIAAAKNKLSDRNPGLTFIHLPVPHPPYIYDRQRKAFDINGQREYSDNLALADQALGELRATLERSGLWEETTIIVSSDHWWRTDFWKPVKNFWSDEDALNQPPQLDHRIPFIIHFAGQKTGMTYDPKLNTVLTHDLVLELLKKGITKPEQIKDWFDRNRTIGESSYQTYADEP